MVVVDAQKKLDVLADFADRQGSALEAADTGSMDAARALDELYEARDWVAEWGEQKPAKPDAVGRPPVPDSRNRFYQWVAWKLEQRNRRAPVRQTMTRLDTAWQVASHVPSFGAHGHQNYGERVYRPLQWMRRMKQQDRIADVWERAEKLVADTGHPVTEAVVRQALAEWKHDNWSNSQQRDATRTVKAERDRLKAQAYVETLFADRDPAQSEAFDLWYREYRKTQRTPA